MTALSLLRPAAGVLAAGLFLPAPVTVAAWRGEVAIDFAVASDSGHRWSRSEKKLVREASEIAFQRITGMHVMNCIARETHPDKFKFVEKGPRGKLVQRSLTKDEFKKLWNRQTGFLNKFKKFSIRIEKTTLKGREIGRGRVAVAVADRASYRLLNLNIKIDVNKMLHYRRQVKDLRDDPKNLWVNTIVHEITHNLGYSHSSGGSWKSDYEGYVPTVAGLCAASDGKYYKFSG